MPGIKRLRNKNAAGRARRKLSIRKKIVGTPSRPRLSVFRSLKHIYCQVIDDASQTVLATASDMEKGLQGDLVGKKKAEKAKIIGQAVAKKLLQKNIAEVVFDRNGYIYHGRVKAVAEGAREGGLKF